MQSHGELKIQDIYNSFHEFEYEHFMFLVYIMHESVNKDQFQFDVNIHEHADVLFHSEPKVEIIPIFYMHYENESVDFIMLI